MHGLTPFQIKVKNQRAWTNHFTSFYKFCPKIEKMHGLTPFQIKVKYQRAWTNDFTFFPNFGQKLKKCMN